MKGNRKIIFIILGVLGIIFSFLLLIVDINLKYGISNNICNFSDVVSCDKIAASFYSHLGPIPVALIGLFFYIFVIFFFFLEKREQVFQKILTPIFLFASFVSVFLFLVSLFDLGVFCPYCFVTYLVNWIGLFLLKNNLNKKMLKIFSKEKLKSTPLPILFSLVIIGLCFVITDGIAKRYSPQYRVEKKLQKQERNIIEEYEKAPSYTVYTMGTPSIGDAENPKIEIIVFHSYFCGHCKHLLNDLEHALKQPKFKDVLKIYSKPIVNEQICEKGMHPQCAIAMLAFELAKKGLFWEFEKRIKNIRQLNYHKAYKIAQELNGSIIDYNRIKKANMPYARTIMSEVNTLEIQGVPVWIVNGKKLVGYSGYPDLQKLLDHILKKE